MSNDIVRVTDQSTKAELEEAIRVLRKRQARLPRHFVDARDEISDEIDLLVEQWLGCEG